MNRNVEPPLGPYECWMVKSNLERIHEGAKPQELVATLRANGYARIALAVDKLAGSAAYAAKCTVREFREFLSKQ